MKRFYKLCLLLCCAVLLAGVCGCGLLGGEPAAKDFSKSGATITLTEQFTEKDLISQTAYYESRKAIVTMLKEEYSMFRNTEYEDMTLTQYAKLVIQVNGLSGKVSEENGLTYFTYEKSTNGKDFKYYATVFKGPDAYWLIQFACETENFTEYQPEFQKWAKSVTFS